MDIKLSPADEAFRADIRAFLDDTLAEDPVFQGLGRA